MIEVKFSVPQRKIALIHNPDYPFKPQSSRAFDTFVFPDALAPQVVQNISQNHGVYGGKIRQPLDGQDVAELIENIIRAYNNIHNRHAMLASFNRLCRQDDPSRIKITLDPSSGQTTGGKTDGDIPPLEVSDNVIESLDEVDAEEDLIPWLA